MDTNTAFAEFEAHWKPAPKVKDEPKQTIQPTSSQTMNTNDVKATALAIMDLAIDLQNQNGLRPLRGQAKLNDWITAVAAAMEISQRGGSSSRVTVSE